MHIEEEAALIQDATDRQAHALTITQTATDYVTEAQEDPIRGRSTHPGKPHLLKVYKNNI